MTDPLHPAALWLVGCGNLGRALLDGWLAAGLDPRHVTVINPARRDLPPGIAHAAKPASDLPRPATIVLAVKPRRLGEVAAQLAPFVRDTLLVSVLAGVRLARLGTAFPHARVARALPNTPARIRRGITLLAGDPNAADRTTVEALGRALGDVHWVGEAQFDIATAVASSSPAWTFRFVDALAAAGTRAGLAPDLAAALALEAVAGAGAYAAAVARPMADLAREVASPGGMTQAGLDMLDVGGALGALLIQAVDAAVARAAALAREADA